MRICPECEAVLQLLDVRRDSTMIVRTHECTRCGRIWQSEEVIVGISPKKWLRPTATDRTDPVKS
jgi:hypothetical protein